MELVIANRALSSWSLRPWLVLKQCGADFTERLVRLDQPDKAARLAEASPSGLVPVLNVDGESIWDSMAISVWCAERYPGAGLWPVDDHARWLARSAACEMHSGFAALRTHCPMMISEGRGQDPRRDDVDADLRRLVSMWLGLMDRFGGLTERGGGPFLFGAWTVTDAFFTPVAVRIRHFGIDLSRLGDDGRAADYVAALLRRPHFVEWRERALADAVPATSR